jgi:hypothetical protein
LRNLKYTSARTNLAVNDYREKAFLMTKNCGRDYKETAAPLHIPKRCSNAGFLPDMWSNPSGRA